MAKDHLLVIQSSISMRNVLSLSYRSPSTGNMSQRDIEPLALYFTQDAWMMVAFCRLRQAHREFRMDGITELKKTDKTFPPNQFRLSDYFTK